MWCLILQTRSPCGHQSSIYVWTPSCTKYLDWRKFWNQYLYNFNPNRTVIPIFKYNHPQNWSKIIIFNILVFVVLYILVAAQCLDKNWTLTPLHSDPGLENTNIYQIELSFHELNTCRQNFNMIILSMNIVFIGYIRSSLPRPKNDFLEE